MSARDNRHNSTALRIQRQQTIRIRWVLFFVNFLLALVIISGWCYINESTYSGIVEPARLWSTVSRSLSVERVFEKGAPMFFYTMSMNGAEPVEVNATMYVYVFIGCAVLTILVESFVVWVSEAFATSAIKRQLRPLYDLAESAQKLTKEQYVREQSRPSAPPASAAAPAPGADIERIHSLENAIGNMKPERPDEELHTGDRDLKGLEDAINSMLARTRDSYSQQIRFVSDASHELRTPIAVIKGYTDMLDRWGKTDETVLEESIDAIKAETEHMNKLVEQLLFLARGDSGRQKLTMTAFSLSDMMRDVYEESTMIDDKHKYELYAVDEVPAVGDAAMIKQATRILVENAKKYTPEGGQIILRAIKDVEGPALVVQDSGVGISERDMSHVFDRFYRADESRTRKQGGTGLGLAIAKWIVDRHEGWFNIVSGEDVGTRITIQLPYRMPPEETKEAPQE